VQGHDSRKVRAYRVGYFGASHQGIDVAEGTLWGAHLAAACDRSVIDRDRLPYLRQAILESMRVLPPFWGSRREAAADCEVAGVPIQRGSWVMVSQWLAHHDPRHYDGSAHGLPGALERCRQGHSARTRPLPVRPWSTCLYRHGLCDERDHLDRRNGGPALPFFPGPGPTGSHAPVVYASSQARHSAIGRKTGAMRKGTACRGGS
jgi:hypothetical protein